MAQSKKDFLILYGSQTGQAQAISEEIFDRAHKEGFNPRRFCLSQVEKKFSLTKECCVVFVCSTTGEGDPPDTAAKFLRRIKKKTLPANHFEHLSYAFLALGDSNYTNFCNCGKAMDSRLLQLGAKHFYDTGYADDAVGLEVVVEPWIENLFPALTKHLDITINDENTNKSMSRSIQQTVVANEEKLNEVVQNSADHNENKILKNSDITKIENIVADKIDATEPQQNNVNVKITNGEHKEELSSLYKSIEPLSTAALKIPSCPDPFLEIKFIDADGSASVKKTIHPSAATDVFKVPIVAARRLTNDNLVKKALEVHLDVSSMDFDYQPGDSFGIVCQNKATEVNYIIQRLGIDDIADKMMTLEILEGTKKKAPTIPDHIALPSTIRRILTNDTDFRAVPRKAFFRMLVDYTGDNSEKRRLQELASVQGAKDFAAFVREQNVGLIESLQTFKSCTPSIQRVLEFLPRLLPREYSVASSPLNGDKCMKFVFNVIQFPDFAPKKRFGLCTRYLDLLTRRLRNEESQTASLVGEDVDCMINGLKLDDEKLEVDVYFRKPTNFRFPDDPKRPLIMIGPGTGVAPFIGFLQHREHMKKSDVNLKLGKAILFYGCRYKDKDFLFRQEIEKYLDDGILDQLYTSFSREVISEGTQCTKYVQENVRKAKEQLLRYIFEENGIVFICGDAKHMGRDVTNTFVELIQEYKNLNKMDAIKQLDKLRETKQFLEDVWT